MYNVEKNKFKMNYDDIYWTVKAEGFTLNELSEKSSNGTGADNWIYQKRIKEGNAIRIEEIIVRCSEKAINEVKKYPGIILVEECKDLEKYKHWNFY